MLNETLHNYLDDLNNNSYHNQIFYKTISENVCYGKITPQFGAIENARYHDLLTEGGFFFIQNRSSKFVGIVQYAGNDLHWYVLPEERKKGYLTGALKEAILPYIFEEFEKEEQIISIDDQDLEKIDFENSSKVAEAIGFKLFDREFGKHKLLKIDFDMTNSKLDIKTNPLDHNRIDQLKN